VATSSTKASRKQTVARWNRRLAWITLPTLFLGTLLFYGHRGRWLALPKWQGDLLTNLFTLFFFIHSAFSVYLFGFPKFSRNIRVVHIWIGYVVFVFVLTSQSLIGVEPWHGFAYGLMWLFIVLHVALSLRFWRQRWTKRVKDPELALYTGGALIRRADH
jgi:hypothetical protein